MIATQDALGRTVTLATPARRIVSLVPSESHSVADLAGVDRLVGRTDFCELPTAVASVVSVGGTKNVDVDAVAGLAPDLVLANKEENARPVVEALIERGLPVHVSFPRTVPDALAYLDTLAQLLGVPPATGAREAFERHATRRVQPRRVFVPIWKDPWMTFDDGAFASDLLSAVGAQNVFGDRPRRYPLAADLGHREALRGERVQGRDTRYPRIRLEEAAERAPDLVLLPDEPYAFGPRERDELAELLPDAEIRLTDGKDLFWYGARLRTSIDRLAELVRR